MQPEIERDPNDRQRARQIRAEQVQRRRMALFICLLALIVLIVVLALTCGGEEEPAVTSTSTTLGTDTTLLSSTFTAELTGDEAVPKVTTTATATLALDYDAETEVISYVLTVTRALTFPSNAFIYAGEPGSPDGAAVYTLFAGPMEEGSFTGELAEGTIVEQDLTGPLRGKTIRDLITLLEEGGAYVSIGNKSHPVDAIRGQIGPE